MSSQLSEFLNFLFKKSDILFKESFPLNHEFCQSGIMMTKKTLTTPAPPPPLPQKVQLRTNKIHLYQTCLNYVLFFEI